MTDGAQHAQLPGAHVGWYVIAMFKLGHDFVSGGDDAFYQSGDFTIGGYLGKFQRFGKLKEMLSPDIPEACRITDGKR